MSEVQRNLKSFRNSVVQLNTATREGRNAALRDYHSHLSPSVQKNLTYSHGSQIYRDKTLGQFLNLINKRPIHMPVRFLGGDDNVLLARAANDMLNIAYQEALSISDTGAHLNSLTAFVREVGFQQHALVPGRVTASMLPERAIVSIVAVIPYGSTLEITGNAQGILYYAAKRLRSKYRNKLAVKFDYVSGGRIGGQRQAGTFPRIQIAHFGNLKPRMQRPGKTAKRYHV